MRFLIAFLIFQFATNFVSCHVHLNKRDLFSLTFDQLKQFNTSLDESQLSKQLPISNDSNDTNDIAAAQPFIQDLGNGIYIAREYALGNVIMIEGDDSVIIIDTTETITKALPIRQAFDSITGGKPCVALIYSHFHLDHVFGGGAFMNPNVYTEVYAHENFAVTFAQQYAFEGALGLRGMRQWASFLNVSAIHVSSELPRSFIPVTQYVKDRTTVQIAGVSLTFLYAPGETSDQLNIWIPDRNRTLIIGDNVYRAFPNIYSIRGTQQRSPVVWMQSLDMVRRLNPTNVVPCHRDPLLGTDQVQTTLTRYRDAIQFVHDQTIRLMNSGYNVDEMIQSIQLPNELKDDAFLQEIYGTVEWTIRAVVDQYQGWFDGTATQLRPLANQARAQMLSQTMGGVAALLGAARQWAQSIDDSPQGLEAAQFALELIDAAQLTDISLANQFGAIQAKQRLLMYMASREVSVIGAAYFLSLAVEQQPDFDWHRYLPSRDVRLATLRNYPVQVFMQSLSWRYVPDRATADLRMAIGFAFGQEMYGFLLRGSVCERVTIPSTSSTASSLNVGAILSNALNTNGVSLPGSRQLRIYGDDQTWKDYWLGLVTEQELTAQVTVIVLNGVNQENSVASLTLLQEFMSYFDLSQFGDE